MRPVSTAARRDWSTSAHRGAIDTEKMYRAAGESALPMGAIVGTTHAITGGKKAAEAKGDTAETPPPSGGPPMAETAALTEAIGGGGQGELNPAAAAAERSVWTGSASATGPSTVYWLPATGRATTATTAARTRAG